MLKNMKIGLRLGLGFGMVLFMLLVGSVFSYFQIDTLADQTTQLYNHPYMVNNALRNAELNIIKINRSMKDVALAKTPADIDKAAGLVDQYDKDALKSLETVKDRFQGDKALIDSIVTLLTKWGPIRQEVIALKRANQGDQAAEIVKLKGGPMVTAITKEMDGLGVMVSTSAVTFMDNAASARKRVTVMISAVTLLALLLGGGLAYIISRSITRPLAGAVVVINTLADGDLTVKVDVASQDEIGQFMAAMGNMIRNLRDMISQTANISTNIASASNQLHASSKLIAAGAEEVALQADTVAAASEEMSSTFGDIARNCAAAATASQRSITSAHIGADVVQEAISGMNIIADLVRQSAQTVEALGTRSEQIGNIVGTIEDIADQTNLLALNAAIEAARAGEQGRGFAVVADEVRALAERTTTATREIGEMIKSVQKETGQAVRSMDEGVQQVDKGTESSRKSSEALAEILDRISEVSVQISQISSAANQQTATTGEVSAHIHQITGTVTQAARGAEETSSAAAQLAGQAEQLQNLIGRFKLV